MGGNVFMVSAAEGHPRLATPRMDGQKYHELKQNYAQLLRTPFPNARSIATAIEAPEKTDFGDIDMIIIDDGEVDWAKVAAEVGAVAWVNRGTDSKPACSLAVHFDGTRSKNPPVKYVLTHANDPLLRKPSSELDHGPYAQVDLVKIGSDLEDWTILYSSYGDLAGILGRIVTNFGFDVTEMGLRLRLQEWDDSSLEEWEHFKPRKDEGKLMLSTNPDETMEFFGLDVNRYRAGFQTMEEIFRWLSESELASRHSVKRERHVPVTREEKKMDRNMFNSFFNEWLPAHLEAEETAIDSPQPKAYEDLRPSLSQLRQKYLDAALLKFDKREEYSTLHQALIYKRALQTAEAKLRPIIAMYSRKKGSALAEVVRAFRRNVEFRDGQPSILPSQQQDSESLLSTFLGQTGRELRDSEAVDKWIKVNFDTVKEIERQRAEEKKKRSASVAGLS